VTTLADRIRGIVGPAKSADADAPPSAPARTSSPGLADWKTEEKGQYVLVETRIAPETIYGRAAVGTVADRLHAGAPHAPLLAAGTPPRSPFLFFDIETTGLAGGAGTLVFLVGCGEFAADNAFVTRQFLLTSLDDEPSLLHAVRRELERAGALVSFNGKSFDAPILETRYLFHRLEWTGGTLPHVDVLHPSRRLWADYECSLVMLEEHVLGVPRVGDLPGLEAPARYFRFLRTRDRGPLDAVLEHNRRDLLALAALTATLLELVRDGATAARDAREAFALGTIYARGGLDHRASEAYVRALEIVGTTARDGSADRIDAVRLAALRALALLSRRSRRYTEAARYWQQILDVRGCPSHIAREATEALAIHHEHRVRDLTAAKTFALRSLGNEPARAWGEAVRHRLARIDRKLRATALPLLFPALPPCPSSPSPPFLPSSGSPTSGRRTSS